MISRKAPKNKSKKSKRARCVKRAAVARQRQRTRGLDEKLIHVDQQVSKSIFGKILHHKQVLSIALVTLGVIYTSRMTIHALGAAMAKFRGHGCSKHGIKQVDRFMSNQKIKPLDLRKGLVAAVVGKRNHINASLDWTDFDKDNQTTLALSLIMRHGRAIPFVWLTVKKSKLNGNQTIYERTAVQLLRESLPERVHVTLLADRGFGNTILFEYLKGIPNLDFIIRFRQKYYIHSDSYIGKAVEAVFRNGRIRVIGRALLTGKKQGPYTVVLYKAAKMKESWCLATSLETCNGSEIVRQYSRRFECEESFRDLKDWRFDLALKHTNIKNEGRRERLLFAFALAAFLLTLVGIESERHNCDRLLRANTSQKRTHSLFSQGREIVGGALPDRLERKCLKAVGKLITIALKQGFCHAMA